MSGGAGHAFICYVREDSAYADDLQELLTNAGIPIWRDTESLWPGENWRERIRDAITRGAIAFVPIFTQTSYAKGASGQNEELYLAADEMRRRRPGVSWLFPVRYDDCSVPALDLGGGRVLDDIQRADLFGESKEENAARLVEAVQRILDDDRPNNEERHAEEENLRSASTEIDRLDSEIKEILRDPAGDIRLFDLVMPIADALYDELTNLKAYPVDGSVDVRAITSQIDNYWRDLRRFLQILVTAGAWARAVDEPVWAEAVARVARSTSQSITGKTVLIEARWFPILPMLYATGIAAVVRQNYGLVRSVAVDATVRERDGARVALAARAHPYQAFQNSELSAQVLALEASGERVDDETIEALRRRSKGNRHTPVSDMLHDRLRESLRQLIPDDDDYSDAFDRFEILLGLIQTDLVLTSVDSEGRRIGPYLPGAQPGRFTWRDRHSAPSEYVEIREYERLKALGASWPPLSGGLFGGSAERAQAAFEGLVAQAERVRQTRW